MKKLLCMLLSTSVLMMSLPLGIFALEENLSNCENVFIDGVEFSVCLDKNFNTVMSTIGLEEESQMVINKNGDAKLSVKNDGEVDSAIVDINNLSEEKVDIIIKSDDGQKTVLDDFEDIQKDEYSGQFATVIIGGIALTTTQWAVIFMLAFIATNRKLIDGLLYESLEALLAIQEYEEKLKNKYFPATIEENIVLISPIAISKDKAIQRIKNQKKGARIDVYTFYRNNARDLASTIGKFARYDGNHRGINLFGVYFNHYHATSYDSAHIFFGYPV